MLSDDQFVRLVQQRLGVVVDGQAGPKTLAALDAQLPGQSSKTTLPWLAEIQKVFGLHEVRDNAALRAWLRSDGKTLGNPAALPWCGDAVETAIKLSLPSEPFEGRMKENPYWARNWLEFGNMTTPVFGAIAVFERGTGGHVGFLTGQDAKSWHVLGGNQSDRVNVVGISKARALGFRWPKTYRNAMVPVPTRATIQQSINEA